MTVAGLGVSVMCVTWVLTTISITVISARIYTRSRVLKRITPDDYLAVFTLLMSLGNAAFLTQSCQYGLGQNVANLMHDPSLVANTVKYVYLCEFFSILCPCFGRISFALMLLSLTPPTVTRRSILWAVIATAFVIDLGTLIISFSQCTPIAAFWDGRPDAHCWPKEVQRDTGFFQGSYGSAVDLTLAAFPASLFWNLNMSLKQRISLSIMMGFGVFAMAASIFKTVELQAITSTDNITHEMAKLAIGWTLEANFVLIAASIPTLRPILKTKKTNSQGNYSDRPPQPRRRRRFPFQTLDDYSLQEMAMETQASMSKASAHRPSSVLNSKEQHIANNEEHVADIQEPMADSKEPKSDAEDKIRRSITVAITYD